jgi:hypothetical protein
MTAPTGQPESDVSTLLAKAVALRTAYWDTLLQLEAAMGGGAWSDRANDKIVDLIEDLAVREQPVGEQALAELERRAKL